MYISTKCFMVCNSDGWQIMLCMEIIMCFHVVSINYCPGLVIKLYFTDYIIGKWYLVLLFVMAVEDKPNDNSFFCRFFNLIST